MRAKHDDLHPYKQFIGELNTTTAELQELFAQEVINLTHDEQLILRDNDFDHPDGWSDAARAVYTKMLARAAAKAKKLERAH